MERLFPGLLLFATLGCSNPAPPTPEPAVVEAKLPCDDPDWAEGDTLFRSPEPSFFYSVMPLLGFSQKIALKKGSLGVIVACTAGTEGHALSIYRTDSVGSWKQFYCGVIDEATNYEVSMPDLNFDGHPDLLIDLTSGGTYGNYTMGFLYGPHHETFLRDTALDLSNLSIDAKNKRLRSRHYGSVYGACIKSLYGWENGSLVLLEEAVIHADTEESAIIRLKKRQKDGTMLHDSITGKLDPLWKIFDRRCAWKGDWMID